MWGNIPKWVTHLCTEEMRGLNFKIIVKLNVLPFSMQHPQEKQPFYLTEEERRTLIAEGLPVPTGLPLTKVLTTQGCVFTTNVRSPSHNFRSPGLGRLGKTKGWNELWKLRGGLWGKRFSRRHWSNINQIFEIKCSAKKCRSFC